MPPPLRLPLPPQTPPACSRQERTGLSERQRSARSRTRSHAGLANLGLPPQECTVGTALAFCGCATNEVETGLQACSLAAAVMRRCTTHTHTYAHTHMHRHTHRRAHTCTGAHTHTHTCTSAHTQVHTRTHAHMHRRAHTHVHTHTHKHTHTHTQTN